MTHKELVKLAGLWLFRSKGCNPVFIEKGSAGCSEIPDAIGWNCDECFIVECKTSCQDLYANVKKNLKLGDRKFFLMSKSLYELCKNNIPDGWGVLTFPDNSNIVRQERFKDSIKFDSCLESEVRYLRSRILEIQRFGGL